MKTRSILLLILIAALFSAAIDVFSGHESENTNAMQSQYCIVDNTKIEGGGMLYQYLNKHLLFCSESCLKTFKNEPAEYTGDALHCPVCSEDDAKKSISAVHNETKYYFCGKGCKSKFENDAEKFLKNYEK